MAATSVLERPATVTTVTKKPVLLVSTSPSAFCFCFSNGSIGLSVSPPLWSRIKYLNNYGMDCHETFHDIHGVQMMKTTEFGDPLIFPLDP